MAANVTPDVTGKTGLKTGTEKPGYITGNIAVNVTSNMHHKNTLDVTGDIIPVLQYFSLAYKN